MNLEYRKKNFGTLKGLVWEENKVLNVLLALIISSAEKLDEERAFATTKYSQKLSGINEPKLKVMCYGPDIHSKALKVDDVECDLQKMKHLLSIH